MLLSQTGGISIIQGFVGVSTIAFYVSPSGNDSNVGTFNSPFKTLAKAQTAMQAGSIKQTYLRAGTYPNTALTLTASDNGTIWSNYAPDGFNSPIVDGGSSSPSTGGNPITIDGGSNISINGFTIQNCKNWGVGIHGGPADPNAIFPNTTANSDSVAITNCIIHDVYTVGTWIGAAVYTSTNTTNLTISNNVAYNINGHGMSFNSHVTYNSGDSPADHSLGNLSGLVVSNNVLYDVCLTTSDSGAIYIQDQTTQYGTGSTPITFENNFIRDYQGNNPTTPSNLSRAVAFYLDEGTSNVVISGNVIANTANVPGTPTGPSGSTTAYWINGGRNNTFSGNIIDLGTTAKIADGGFAVTSAPNPTFPMTGNTVDGNILIGNWSGTQQAALLGGGPGAGWFFGGTPATPIPGNNLYYNYGSGSLATTSNISGHNDSAPITTTNPQISGNLYTIAGGSPVFSSPLNFPVIAGNWGPPGYVIPTGTQPCYTNVPPPQVTWLIDPNAISTSQINMTWNSAVGATTYTLKRNGTTIASGITGVSYSDTGLTASTAYTYQVAGVNALGTVGTYSIVESATTQGTGMGPLAYLKSLMGQNSGYLVGHHWDQFSSQIWDQFCIKNGGNTYPTTGQSFPNISPLNNPSGGGSSTNTNICPALVGIWVNASGQVGGGVSASVGVSTANLIIANNCIPFITYALPSPATGSFSTGYSGEMPGAITPGNAYYNTLQAGHNAMGAALAGINGPFVIRIWAEGNLTRGGQYWYATGGQNSSTNPTNAQYVTLFQQAVSGILAGGVSRSNMILCYCTTLFNSGFSQNDPGSSYRDIGGIDTYINNQTSAQMISTMNSNNAAYFENLGIPWVMGELGGGEPVPGNKTADMSGFGNTMKTSSGGFKNLVGGLCWPQGWAISNQLNGLAYMQNGLSQGQLPTIY